MVPHTDDLDQSSRKMLCLDGSEYASSNASHPSNLNNNQLRPKLFVRKRKTFIHYANKITRTIFDLGDKDISAKDKRKNLLDEKIF